MITFKEYLAETAGVAMQQMYYNSTYNGKTLDTKIKYAENMIKKRQKEGNNSSLKYWETKLEKLKTVKVK